MAEEKQAKQEKKERQEGKEKQEGKTEKAEEKKAIAMPAMRSIVRILSTDIPGDKNVYAGLTNIKGISWSMSNAICNKLNINRQKKMTELTKQEIDKLIEFIKSPNVPAFILNRRNDFETGRNLHFIGSDLDLRRDFDIKRLKKIRSYKGWRHSLGQPVRGQRTRSHFRKEKTVGVLKKAAKAQAAAAAKPKAEKASGGKGGK